MKTKYCLKFAAMAALLSFGLSGCGSLSGGAGSGKESKVVTLADGRKVVVGTHNGEGQGSAASNASSKTDKKLTPPDKSKTDKKSGKKKKDKKQQAIAAGTEDRQSVGTTLVCADKAHDHEVGASATPTVGAATQLPADFTINGEWTIYSVRGNIVTGEERPYITFDLAQKRFYGNNGCNYINGGLTLEAGHKLSFGEAVSTMKMCQDDQYQYLINLALNDVRSFDVRQESPLTFLDLKDNTGRVILVLRRHNMDFLNGAWKVTELNGTPLTGPDDATMTFDTSDLKVHGTTGCNIFNGEMFIDPDKVNSLQMMKLATTRMGCPPDSRETEFLLALEEVETARRTDGGKVVLCSDEGKVLFTLEHMELRDADSPE